MQSYPVKVTAKTLNCRFAPTKEAAVKATIKAGQVHNIVSEQNGWGQLENGLWIMLEFTVPVHNEPEPTEVFVTGLSVLEDTPVNEDAGTIGGFSITVASDFVEPSKPKEKSLSDSWRDYKAKSKSKSKSH